MRLHDDAEQWQTIRDGALDRLAHDNNRSAYIDSLAGILHDVAVGEFAPR